MTRKYFKLAGLAYLASVTFPILLLWLARLYPANVFNGLVMILILAILTGLIKSRCYLADFNSYHDWSRILTVRLCSNAS